MQLATLKPSALFQALSDPIRIRIIRLLASAKDEVCLCELSGSLDEPEYKLSRHLKVLRQSGLLSAEKEGRWVYHRLAKGSDLNLLYRFIRGIDDSDQQHGKDLSRFNELRDLRGGERCRSLPRSSTIASV